MPGPRETFWGGEMDMSSPEAKKMFFAIAQGDPRFVEMLGQYRTGAITEPPRGSMDYTSGQPRTAEEARFLQWYMDQMRKNIEAQRGMSAKGYSSAPATKKEADPLLIELLGE